MLIFKYHLTQRTLLDFDANAEHRISSIDFMKKKKNESQTITYTNLFGECILENLYIRCHFP